MVGKVLKATPKAWSGKGVPVPPMYVEYSRSALPFPPGLISETKPSPVALAASVD